MRFCLTVSCFAAVLGAQSTASSADTEKALLDRVTKFYAALTEGKYKNAFVMVAEEAQEAFMGMPKTGFQDVQLKSIEWADGGKSAKVAVIYKREIPVMGKSIPSAMRDDSNWKLEGGEWVWAGKAAGGPRTNALGIRMPDTPAASEGPQLSADEVKKRIAEAPSAAQMSGGAVQVVGPKSLEFSKSRPGEAEFIVKNPLPGWVVVKMVLPKLAGLEWVVPEKAKRSNPAEAKVAPESALTIKIRWTPGTQPGKDATFGRIELLPVSRSHQFALVWKE